MHIAAHPHILVVEDDPTIAALICDILEEHGYCCTTASSADEALQVLDRLRPTLITLDLGLPGGGGGRVLRRIRDRTELKATPVVIISAERLIPPELYSTSQAVLAKPFEIDQLLTTIEVVLATHLPCEQERVVGGAGVKCSLPRDDTGLARCSRPEE